MAYRLRFSSRARRETGEAHQWYEGQSAGLGDEFLAAMELQMRRVMQAPMLHAEIVDGVHRALLPRFPYGVFYALSNDLIHVLAVMHNARNPRRWPSSPVR